MSCVPSTSPAQPTGPSPSRRSLLRGGTLLSLSAITAAACAPRAALSQRGGQGGTFTGEPAQAGHLVLDYQPSQPTGWASEHGESPTIGGHITSRNFTFKGRKYLLSLLPVDPVYANSPGIRFRQTLASAWGAHYSFRYAGGLPSGAKLAVESSARGLAGP